MKFMASAHSDVGIKKKTNQDSFCLRIASTPTGEIVLAAVCDGMGGLRKGELASATVIRAFAHWFDSKLPQIVQEGYENEKVKVQWHRLIEMLNVGIGEFGDDKYIQIGTTLTALLICGDDMLIAQVGDSRAYRITDEIVQLTEDQTVAQRDIKLGVMKPEDVDKDTRQNVLIQCIGASSKVSPEFIEQKVQQGETYMLCSDGFRHKITIEEFLNTLNSGLLINESVMKKKIIDLVELNKQREEKDNITAMLIKAI